MFGLNDYATPIEEFPDPYITCCFVGDDKLFVALFHNYEYMHYHFLWDIQAREIIGKPDFDAEGQRLRDKPIKFKFETHPKNFPYKCFYSVVRDECYIFYR